jgi:hypothetical protein
MKVIFKCILFVLCYVQSYAGQLNLVQGWNLYSPVISAEVDVATHLGTDIISGLNKIWVFDQADSQWKKWEPSGAQNFTKFKPSQGYWVKMDAAKTLNLSDSVSRFSISLNGAGWKLTGTSSSAQRVLDDTDFFKPSNITTGTKSNLTKIWGYDPSGAGWQKHVPDATNNQLLALNPGYGYWFKLGDSIGIDGGGVDLNSLFPPVCPGCPGFNN